MKKYWYRLLGKVDYWWLCIRYPKKYECPRCHVKLRFNDVHHVNDDYSRRFCVPDPNMKWGGVVLDGKLEDAP